MNQNEIKFPLFQLCAGSPNTLAVPGVDGQYLWDSVGKQIYVHNGTTWIAITSLTSNSATNAILAQVATATIKGRITAGTGNVEDLTAGNVRSIINVADGANNYSHPNHSGDVTSSGDGATTIANAAVTNAKLANVATATIKGRKTAATGAVEDLTASDVRTLLNVADGANAYVHPNHSGDVTSTGDGATVIGAGKVTLAMQANMATGSLVYRKTAAAGAPEVQTLATLKTDLAVSKSDVGLANVTNDAQVKKLASSTSGFVPTWNGTSGDALGAGYEVETTLAGSTTKLARADAIKTYVDGLLAANDAMVFKGTVGTGGTQEIAAFNSLATYGAGWTYRVITAGTIKGKVCEIGDMVTALVDRAGSGNVDADWTVLQTNLDGAVIGPASAVGDNFASFNSTTGKLIKDSGSKASDFAATSHTHSSYGAKYSADVGGSTNITITHNLNTRDLVVTLREVASPYAVVIADIEFTTVNAINIKFAVAPSAAQFRVTVMG